MLETIVYISAATSDFREDDLDAMLATARRNNGASGITGMLLYAEGAFIQVLEGETEALDTTMERIRRNMGLDPLVYETDRLLMELSFGDWEGHTFAELDALKPGTSHLRDSGKWNFCPPGEGAESYAMLAARVARWLEGLERPTVCVTHGGIIRSLFHLVEGMDGEEAATLNVPQDRLLVLEGNRLSWV